MFRHNWLMIPASERWSHFQVEARVCHLMYPLKSAISLAYRHRRVVTTMLIMDKVHATACPKFAESDANFQRWRNDWASVHPGKTNSFTGHKRGTLFKSMETGWSVVPIRNADQSKCSRDVILKRKQRNCFFKRVGNADERPCIDMPRNELRMLKVQNRLGLESQVMNRYVTSMLSIWGYLSGSYESSHLLRYRAV